MTTKPKTETKPQPDSEPDHGTIVVDLGAFVPTPPSPLGIKKFVVDGGGEYSDLYVVRTDERIFRKRLYPQDPWEEIETTTLFEQ